MDRTTATFGSSTTPRWGLMTQSSGLILVELTMKGTSGLTEVAI